MVASHVLTIKQLSLATIKSSLIYNIEYNIVIHLSINCTDKSYTIKEALLCNKIKSNAKV